ncbi:MAG: alpha/beta hydrolase family protein [Sedimentisphaeraceae bacterium JB056]
MEHQIINYNSSIDGSVQSALGYFAQGSEARPLLVALHEWSSDYTQALEKREYIEFCRANDWHFIHPDFRGPNNNPMATGSKEAVRDIIDAVEFVKDNHSVDDRAVFLVGVSGGGYTALMTLSQYPDIWSAVSVWVPIVDLARWYEQCRARGLAKYCKDIELSCGGVPEKEGHAFAEAQKRSPINYLRQIPGLDIDINAGINDGHIGSVPIEHSFRAFNAIVDEIDRVPDNEISEFVSKKRVPDCLKGNYIDDAYGVNKVLFRRISKKVRLTIFDGGHEILFKPVFNWLKMQLDLV